jgi:hypothetical protein
MARPTLDPAKAKTERLNLRLTPVELARLNAQASRAGMPVTAFARAAALRREIRAPRSDAPDFHTRHELRAIGNNLNQIARRLNSGGDVDHPHLDALLVKLDTIFDQWLDDGAARQQARP